MKNRYHCKHCGKTIVRESDKVWIKSYCETTGKNTHITKIPLDPPPGKP